ncbi:MAG: DUF4422 domain-containing protein [Synergistaceae bacterium]|nr:DUF4422 domain-containing protein [Synergistaceae bacterium]MBQ3449379.1 DUF4422 domain-containing protein [Synergistaceae bacterium]MBQ3694497.1 DUF4422 domain-containing protein [Synergistaceae bacterium]MBQ9627774.1 DUF4422 domain-containing protein [Synergistaceae bacterium]MBR0250370.1 DUF4422 domain-containing protein [Synergistaceae bacterium]
MNVKIIIACHKKCDVPEDKNIYFPVHVGAEGKESIGFTPDNTGDNISAKNFMYSELTGLYWAWKNLDCDYLGLIHYRRCFSIHRKFRNASMKDILTPNEVRELLSHHKIIVPQRRKYYIETLYSHYVHTLYANHIDITREIIAAEFPEYIESFDIVMRRTWGFFFNMYIMPKTLSDEYCSWLFRILFMLEKKVSTAGMNAFDMRYPGRISECLFNVWLNFIIQNGKVNERDIFEVPYIYTGKINWPKKITSFLMAKFFNRKYKKSF